MVISPAKSLNWCGYSYHLVASHLFFDGFQVSVTDKVLSELHPGQSGAPGIWEELEEALLWFKVTVCVDQFHVSVKKKQQQQKAIKSPWLLTWQAEPFRLLLTCWPACRRSRWGGRCLSAGTACSWSPGSTSSSSGSSGRRQSPESWGCRGCLLLWLPCSPLLLWLRSRRGSAGDLWG